MNAPFPVPQPSKQEEGAWVKARLEEGWDPWSIWASIQPHAMAYEWDSGSSVSYLEAHNWAQAGEQGLRAAGIKAGEVVALWGAPSPRWWAALWSLFRLGAIAFPLHRRWVDAEIEAVLQRTRAACLWAPSNENARCSGWGIKTINWPESPCNTAFLPSQWDPSHEMLIATSGSSGAPKLARLSRRAILASAHAWNQALGVKQGERWWLGLGGYHVGGLGVALRQALAGGTCVLGAEAFQAAKARQQWVGCDWVSAVPLQAAEVLQAPGPSLPGRMRRLIVGGQAAGPGLLDAFGPLAVASYGLSESASGLCLAETSDPPACAGRPLPGVSLRVLAAPHEVGEIVACGPMLMEGYFEDEVATSKALDAMGCLHTGDLGRLDESNRLWVLGRAEELIVSGGEKTHPGELEAVLLRHPSVSEAAVVGVPNPRFGQHAVAFWRPVVHAKPSENELWAHINEHLAPYKRPKKLIQLNAFPRLAGGKLDRQSLKRWAEEAGRQ